jgi:adenylate kinase
MFRDAIQKGTDLGQRAEEYMQRGELVPDHLVLELLEERLAQPDAVEGYLLDGFPRTVTQAKVLDGRLRGSGKRIDAVLSLEAPHEVLVKRLSGRSTCPQCQASYNRNMHPPRVENVCDQCGARLVMRKDDTEATVRRRLNEYVAKTTPVLDFFKAEHWPVCLIGSVGGVEEVYGRIRRAVDEAPRAGEA